jgi:hypothetical protein
MKLGQGGRARRTPALVSVIFAAALLGGCNTAQQGSPFASSSRGASIAFDSIDGPPPEIFQRLVRDLNAEAQTRRLTMVSRSEEAAYRVRGYLGAHSKASESSITWMWDVYDGERQRVVRLSGEEKIKGRHANPWTVLDEAAVQRIARNSMEQLGAFLASGNAVPAAQPAAAVEGSPEAEGIIRISAPQADPVPSRRAGPQAQQPRPITVAQDSAD